LISADRAPRSRVPEPDPLVMTIDARVVVRASYVGVERSATASVWLLEHMEIVLLVLFGSTSITVAFVDYRAMTTYVALVVSVLA
jgi:hypothetical protein